MPPCASGPVFTVNRPSLNGAACALAGVGNLKAAAATPAAVPAIIVRREILRAIAVLPECPRGVLRTALLGHFIYGNRSWAYFGAFADICALSAVSSSFRRSPDVKPGLRVVASHTSLWCRTHPHFTACLR